MFSLQALSAQLASEDAWTSNKSAGSMFQQQARLQERLGSVQQLEQDFADQYDLLGMALDEGDTEMVAECEAAISELELDGQRMALESLISGAENEVKSF